MMDGRFANLADSGRQLGGRLVQEGIRAGSLALAVVPNGVPVARRAARVAGLELAALRVSRSSQGVRVVGVPDVSGRMVVVIDDGVETGTVASAVATALREAGAGELVLAVPVCPEEAMADLSVRYDRIVALEIPTTNRPLASHFEDFDPIDEATADEILGRVSG